MDNRLTKIIIGSAGGTASYGAKTYKISLPSSWLEKMKINTDNRQVEMSFDGDTITISKLLSPDEFAKKNHRLGHKVFTYKFFDDDKLCTTIFADFTNKTVKAKNHTNILIKTAFGRKEAPVWEDFMQFLEERCVPKSRGGIREYLEAIGVDEYNAVEIIKITKGKMEEDNQWLDVEEYQ